MRAWIVLLVLFVGAAISFQGCGPNVGPRDEVAVLETSYGRIIIEFLPEVAPRNVANFKQLTREGFYDGTKFHKIITDTNRTPMAVQGGDPNTISGARSTWGYGQPGQHTVPGEFSKNVHTERGMVAASRKATDPNSATSQFFICLTGDPSYDGKYSIFGKVVDGMNVVESIARAPIVRNTTQPVDPVVVKRAYLAKRDAVLEQNGNPVD